MKKQRGRRSEGNLSVGRALSREPVPDLEQEQIARTQLARRDTRRVAVGTSPEEEATDRLVPVIVVDQRSIMSETAR